MSAPSLPGNQRGREKISSQCWANHDYVTLPKFEVVVFEGARLDGTTGMAIPGSSCDQ
jgi:hypothetical protein